MVKTIFTFIFVALIAISPAKAQTELRDGMYAQMQTNKGLILLRLFYDKTPQTVANFVGLAEGSKQWRDPDTQQLKQSKFYDGIKFHRVIKDFMIQSGDPLGTGAGGPGFRFRDEFHPQLKHNKPGILSMANSGPHTNGSQFFITHTATPWLNNKHSVFGEVEQGMEVVNQIAQNDVILSLTILRVGATAQNFDAAIFEKRATEEGQKLAEKNKKELPPTVLTAAEPYLDKIDLLLIMTVNPGFGGQSLIERVFPKMERIRKRIDQLGLSTLIEVDGGVKTHNAHQFTAAGAHALVSGSGVFGAEDRTAAIAALKAS